MNRYASLPPIPEPLKRLPELAVDLWWSWHPEARDVFRRLDYRLWRATAHNPVRMLWVIPRAKIEAAAADPEFVQVYNRAIAALDAGRAAHNTWWASRLCYLRWKIDCLFFSRVRDSSITTDLRRRVRRSGGRPLQGSERSWCAARWRGVHVPAGVLSSVHLCGRVAGRELRAVELGRCADSTRAHTRR